MSSSLINSANAPVARGNRHINFGRFVKLEQPCSLYKYSFQKRLVGPSKREESSSNRDKRLALSIEDL